MARPTRTDLILLSEFTADGLATRAELIAAGVDPAVVARRCRPGGPWRRLLPGIVMLNSGRPSQSQLIRAALRYAEPGAVLTGLEAARLHGVVRLPEFQQVHVLVPHGRHVSSRAFMLVERTRRRPNVVSADGLPLAEPARCLMDAARRMDRLDPIRAMVADAVQRRICDVPALAAELSGRGLSGSALPRRVLAEIADGVRSAAEAWARSLVLRSRLVPDPAWNVAIHTPEGRLLAVVDAWWDEVGLAWEIDSREFHLAPADYDRTLRRQSALAAAGVLVVHTVPSRLRDEPAMVLTELAAAYQQAAARAGRPNVTATLWRDAPTWAAPTWASRDVS
jgi:hypothetical protein